MRCAVCVILLVCLLPCCMQQHMGGADQGGSLQRMPMDQMMHMMQQMMAAAGGGGFNVPTIPPSTTTTMSAFDALPPLEQLKMLQQMMSAFSPGGGVGGPQQSFAPAGGGGGETPKGDATETPSPAPQIPHHHPSSMMSASAPKPMGMSVFDPMPLLTPLMFGGPLDSVNGNGGGGTATGGGMTSGFANFAPLAGSSKKNDGNGGVGGGGSGGGLGAGIATAMNPQMQQMMKMMGSMTSNLTSSSLMKEFNNFVVGFRPFLAMLGDAMAESMGDMNMPCPLFFDTDPAASVTIVMPAMLLTNVKQCLNPMTCNMYSTLRMMLCMTSPINCQMITKMIDFCQRFHTPTMGSKSTAMPAPSSLPIHWPPPTTPLPYRPPPPHPPTHRPFYWPPTTPQPPYRPPPPARTSPPYRPPPPTPRPYRPPPVTPTPYRPPPPPPSAPNEAPRPSMSETHNKFMKLLIAIAAAKTTEPPPTTPRMRADCQKLFPNTYCNICVSSSYPCSPPLEEDLYGICSANRRCCKVMGTR